MVMKIQNFGRNWVLSSNHLDPMSDMIRKLLGDLDYSAQALTRYLKFIYSEKATKFCEISTVDLTVTT